MRKIYEHRGSVTIFLLVIMLPMLVFSFSVVDLCKIFMAKDVAMQATDVALNSGLTSYDKVLKDMYGIMATSATEDELTKKLTTYYVATLESQGVTVSEDAYSETTQMIASVLGTGMSDVGTNDNFLNVYSFAEQGGTSITADKLEVSAASNPDVMHRQIVEYMKYRGPVYLTAGILEKINVLKDLPNQSAAMDAKLEFEKTLSDINNESLEVYILLELFFCNNSRMETGSGSYNIAYPDEKSAKNLIGKYEFLSNQAIPYSTLKNGSTEYIPSDVRDNLDKAAVYGQVYKAFAKSIDKKNGTITPRDWISDIDDSEVLNDPKNHSSADDVAEKLTDSFDALATWVKNTSGLGYAVLYDVGDAISDLKGYAKNPNGYDTNNIKIDYDVVNSYAAFFKNSSSSVSKEFYNLCEKFADAYIDANQYQEYLGDKLAEEDDEDKKKEIQADIDTLTDALSDTVSTSFGIKDPDDFAKAIADSVEKVDKFVEDCRREANTAYNAARNKLNTIIDACYKQYVILRSLTSDNGRLQKVYELYSEAKEEAESYKEAADKIETDSMKTSFNAQYVNEAKDIDELNQADLDKLVNDLKGMIKYYKDYIDVLLDVKLFGQNLIKDYQSGNPDGFSQIAKHIDNNALSGTDHIESKAETIDELLSSYTQSGFGSISTIAPLVNRSLSAQLSKWTDNNSDVIKSNELYKQIVKTSFPVEETEKDTSAKDKITETSNSTPSAESIVKDNGSDSSSGGSGDSGDSGSSDEEKNSGAEPSDGSDFTPSDYTLFKDYVKTVETSFAVATGTEMPSSTSTPDMSSDDDASAGAMELVSSIGDLFADLAKAARDNLYITEYLTNNFSCQTTPLSADEVMMSGIKFADGDKANVVWYGGELEYILYGLDTLTANKVAAGGAVFGVRFVLNLIYSFTDKEITATTSSIATAAAGLFPFAIPLIKAVLHIGLAIAESSYDLMVLLDGGSVPIFKTTETWVCKGSNIVRKVGAEVLGKVSEKLIDVASDALCDEITKLASEGKEVVARNLESFNDVVDQELEKIEAQVQNDIITPINNAVSTLLTEFGSELSQEKIEERLTELVASMKSNLIGSQGAAENNLVAQAETAVLDYLEGQISTLSGTIASHADELVKGLTGMSLENVENEVNTFADKMNKLLKGVTEKISAKVKSLREKVEEKVEKTIDSLAETATDGVSKGADKLKESLQTKLDQSIRGHEDYDINYKKGTTAKTKTTAMISMTYKEYMYIFTVIGLACNESNMLQRAAQLMTANVRNYGGDDWSDYDINKACTIINATSKASVRTVLFGAIFKDGQLDLSGVNRQYQFTNVSYAGY